jgi:hypothetical protein
LSALNPNPNEPRYPYSGGTDNPGDDTSVAGGPSNVSAVETGAPPTAVLHPPIVSGISQRGTDTVLAGGVQAVPSTGTGWARDDFLGETDTGGVTVDPVTGNVRVSGQDEVAGATETTSGITPVAFPEPTP